MRDRTKAQRRVRLMSLSVLATLTALASVAVLILWIRSHVVEDELRWMRTGVHRHIESARGLITYRVTTGWQSEDYMVWASSPDLSHGRDPNWDAAPSRQPCRCYVEVPYLALLLMAVSVASWAWYVVWRGVVTPSDGGRSPT